MKHISKMLAAALGIFVAFDSNATNARVDTSALDNFIIKSYPQNKFGNVLAFQFIQKGQPMIGVLKNGNWREALPSAPNVVQISINDIIYAANRSYGYNDKYRLDCYTDIFVKSNKDYIKTGGYGALNEEGYNSFKRILGTYNNLTNDNKELVFNMLIGIPKLPENAVNPTLNNIAFILHLPVAAVNNAYKQWWRYVVHTEPQFHVLQTIVRKRGINNLMYQQVLKPVLSSKYEPCKSCRDLIVVQNSKFRFLAIDKDAGFLEQYNLNSACLWNEFSKILSAEMAETICNLKQKHTKRQKNEASLLKLFDHLIFSLSTTVGHKITVSNGHYK